LTNCGDLRHCGSERGRSYEETTMDQVKAAIRDCCVGMTVDEIAEQIRASWIAEQVEDVDLLARFVAAIAQE